MVLQDGLDVQSVLKRNMAKLMGGRSLCPQEVCDLLFGLPLIRCSHTFVKVSLGDQASQLDLDSQAVNDPDQERERKVEKVTLLQAYAHRLQKELWSKESTYLTSLPDLPRMRFEAFAKIFGVFKRGPRKNKIKLQDVIYL